MQLFNFSNLPQPDGSKETVSTKDFLGLDMSRRYIRTINIPSLRDHKVGIGLLAIDHMIQAGQQAKSGLECPLEGIFAKDSSQEGRPKMVLQIV